MEPEQKSLGYATESQMRGHNLDRAKPFKSTAVGLLLHNPTGDTCDTWNQSCMPRLEQSSTSRSLCQEGKQSSSYLRSACWVGPGRQSSRKGGILSQIAGSLPLTFSHNVVQLDRILTALKCIVKRTQVFDVGPESDEFDSGPF